MAGRQDLDRLRGELISVAVQYGLREIRAVTDEEIITVSEPGLDEDPEIQLPDYGLKIETRKAEI